VPCSSYTLIVLDFFCSSSLSLFFLFVHLTMAGSADDDERTPPQSHCTKGIVQALVCKVKKHIEDLDADVHVTNEKIGVLEVTQLVTNTKIGTMEGFVARIDTSLTTVLRRFDYLMTREHDRHQGHNNNNDLDEQVEDN
jgi:hypothetical protein